MREPVEKIIDGERYTFCQLPPKRSLKLMMRILRIVGPTLGVAVDGVKGSVTGAGVDVQSLMAADIDLARIVAVLCERLDQNEVEAIVDDLLSQTIHAGQGEVSRKFDALFGGRLPHLFKVVYAALLVEYSDFLAAGPVLGAFLKAGSAPGQAT